MIRRRLVVKRVDPWSVLKLGMFLNITGGVILLLTGTIVWSVIRRLQMIERSCTQVQNIFGLEECAVEGATVFRMGFTMVALWVVVMTAVLVFTAFLYNLIADLTGGIEMSAVDHTPGAAQAGGGVEVAPQLRQTSPRVVDAPEGVSTAVPADAVDRHAREPSKLKQAVQVAASKVGEVSKQATKQATEALTAAAQPAAENRAERTEAETQSMEAVRRQHEAVEAARRTRGDGARRQRPQDDRGGNREDGPRSRGARERATVPPRRRVSREATELTFEPRGDDPDASAEASDGDGDDA